MKFAGSLIVDFFIKDMGGDDAAAVSAEDAMETLSQAMAGHYDEGRPYLLDETEFEHLSFLRVDAGVRTDMKCDLAINSDTALDCTPMDEWSVLRDQAEDFAAAPVAYAQDPARLVYVAVGCGALLAMLLVLCCCCNRCRKTHTYQPKLDDAEERQVDGDADDTQTLISRRQQSSSSDRTSRSGYDDADDLEDGEGAIGGRSSDSEDQPLRQEEFVYRGSS